MSREYVFRCTKSCTRIIVHAQNTWHALLKLQDMLEDISDWYIVKA